MKSLAERRPRKVESRHNSRIKEFAQAWRGAPLLPTLPWKASTWCRKQQRAAYGCIQCLCAAAVEELLEHVEVGEAEVLIVAEDAFLSAALTGRPQGIAALVETPEFNLQAMLSATPLVVIAGGLQDPGNLGTLVRSAEAFGATGMIVLPGTVSLWNAKALRASSRIGLPPPRGIPDR